MRITEIHALSASQVNDVLCLMSELNPGLAVTSEVIIWAAKSVNFHHFPLMDGERFMCTAPKSAVSSFYQKMGAEKRLSQAIQPFWFRLLTKKVFSGIRIKIDG